jgi:hypothetical protein
MGRLEHNEKTKLHKLPKVNASRLTLVLYVDPFLHGGMAGPRIQIILMIKGLVDLGVDLHITELLREWIVGTTRPQIHPHSNRPLMEQLSLAAEKGLHEVHARQPPPAVTVE